jgi:hypothetical protein
MCNKLNGIARLYLQARQNSLYFLAMTKPMPLLLLVWVGTAGLFAQNPTYAPFPGREDVQNVYWHQVPGCGCGIYPNHAVPQLRAMQVSPTVIKTKTGQAVTVRYDASAICNGQTVRDTNGNVVGHANGPLGSADWQVGTVQALPDTFGIISLPGGYTQASQYSISIKVTVQCYDTGAKCTAPGHYNTCSASATIPVTVLDTQHAKPQASSQSSKTSKPQPAE